MPIEMLDLAAMDADQLAERAEADKIRAEEARQLLRNPLLREALTEIESRLIEQLAMVEVSPDRVARLQAILAAKRVFERYLTATIETGKLVLEEERRRLTMAERVRSIIGR